MQNPIRLKKPAIRNVLPLGQGIMTSNLTYSSVTPSEKLITQKDEEWLETALREFSHFAGIANTNSSTQITTNEVEYFDPRSHRVFLTNGEEFVFSDHYIQIFKARAALWAGFLNGHAQEYWGQWNMNESESIKFARDFLSRLGYWQKPYIYLEEPDVKRAPLTAGHTITRICVSWAKDGMYVSLEVDTSNMTVKSFCYTNLTRGNNNTKEP